MRKLYALLWKLLRPLGARIIGGRAARAGAGAEGRRRAGAQGVSAGEGGATRPAEVEGVFEDDGRTDLTDESENSAMTRNQNRPEGQPPQHEQEHADGQSGSKRFEWVKEQLKRLEEQNRKFLKDSQKTTNQVIINTREIGYLRSENLNLQQNHQQLARGLRDVQARLGEITQQVAELFDRHAALRGGAAELTQRLAAVEQSVKDLRDVHVAERLNVSGSLSVAGSDGQPRLIANKLRELRAQNTRRVTNSILGHMNIDGDRRANSAWVGNILSHEIYIRSQDMLRGESDWGELSGKAVSVIRRGILHRLGIESENGLPPKLLQELEQLIIEGVELTYKAVKAKPAGALWLEPEGTPLDADRHEVMAGRPDAAAVSLIQFTSHPGYKVNDVIYVKALVYTKDSPTPSPDVEAREGDKQETGGF